MALVATPVGVLAMFTDVAAAVALLLLLSVAKVTWLSFSTLLGYRRGYSQGRDGTEQDLFHLGHVLSQSCFVTRHEETQELV